MLRRLPAPIIPVLVFILSCSPWVYAAPPKVAIPHIDSPTGADIERMLNPEGYVIILGTGRNFLSLERQAKAIARASGLPYQRFGIAYSTKTGLSPDYWFRREDTIALRSGKESHFISIEKSDAYPGLKENLYIIVGGICSTPRDAKSELALYRPFVPTAYAPKTKIYMGCRS